MYSKVFGIGSPKTGTSSLGEAFKLLGFKHKSWDPELWAKYEEGDFETIFDVVKKFDSFEDGPWNGPDLFYQKGEDFYKVLDQEFPNSKFILTIRDTKSWIKSHESHFSASGLQQIPSQYWIKNYDKELMLNRYQNRNNQIIKYFENRKNDLLIMDICNGDGWDIICPFLGVDYVEKPFPHKNVTKRKTKLTNILLNKLNYLTYFFRKK